MAGPQRRLRLVLGLVAALFVSLGWAASAPPADAALPAWNGGINLYRTGVFSTQKTWLWCTAADVQIMRNIKYHQVDHSRSNQSKYFTYMRAHNRYSLPLSAGVDPKGWEMGLRRYVDARYRVQAYDTFAKALKLAAARMRRTNLPVAVAVDRGNHGWVMHGFTATADPLKTSTFTVTSVRVSGPLWGLQNRTFGYDMRPNTKLTVSQFKSFFTKWWYGPKRMIYDNKFVSIQPLTTTTSTAGAATTGSAATNGSTEDSSVAAGAAATVGLESPAPSIAASVPVASAPTTTPVAEPAAANDPRPALPIVLVVAGIGLAIVVLLATIPRTPRSPRRLKDPRAGWSS
jgi:hypothetical protein